MARLQQRLRALALPGASEHDADALMSVLRDAALPVGRAAVRGQLQRCLHDAAALLDPAAHLALEQELARLEASYG